MDKNEPAFDPKLAAVLARLCERRGSLTKTQAVKLPYLIDVIAKHVVGKRMTRATYQAWKCGVVAPAIWHGFPKSAERVGIFSIEELLYSEGAVCIRLASPAPDVLSPAERAIVDYVADEYGGLDFEDLGKLTKSMNPGIRSWGSNQPVPVDEDAYARLSGRWDSVLRRLQACDTEDQKSWTEVTDHSPEFFKKSLGV
jgi:uncharacterized phage-associated protein